MINIRRSTIITHVIEIIIGPYSSHILSSGVVVDVTVVPLWVMVGALVVVTVVRVVVKSTLVFDMVGNVVLEKLLVVETLAVVLLLSGISTCLVLTLVINNDWTRSFITSE